MLTNFETIILSSLGCIAILGQKQGIINPCREKSIPQYRLDDQPEPPTRSPMPKTEFSKRATDPRLPFLILVPTCNVFQYQDRVKAFAVGDYRRPLHTLSKMTLISLELTECQR